MASSTSFNPRRYPARTVESLIFFLCMQMRRPVGVVLQGQVHALRR